MSEVTLPAETVRRLSEQAVVEIREAREDNRNATARNLQRVVSESLEKTVGKDGEFVAINEQDASTLAAFGRSKDNNSYAKGARNILEHFGVW